MRFSFLILLALSLASFAQTVTQSQPKPGGKGVYEVAASELTTLDSSPKFEFPRELSAYEMADKVGLALTISPEGKVTSAKAVSGKIEALKHAAEKMATNLVFQPYVVNGSAVPVRTTITFTFDNTFDHYRDPDGDAPVHLSQDQSQALLVKQVPPHYPPDARAMRLQGQVNLRVIIGKDGRVSRLHILNGHPMLVPGAYDAVRQWEYKPYVENGKALPVDTKVTINFTLAGF